MGAALCVAAGSRAHTCTIRSDTPFNDRSHTTHPSSIIRCNEYNLKDYLPVYVGDEPVGYAHHDFVSELTLLQQG